MLIIGTISSLFFPAPYNPQQPHKHSIHSLISFVLRAPGPAVPPPTTFNPPAPNFLFFLSARQLKSHNLKSILRAEVNTIQPKAGKKNAK